MSNSLLKSAIPHIIAVVLFMILSGVYYAPEFSGKVLNQSDNIQARGMQKEIFDVKKKTGKHPLWTNSAFGGMPVYQIHMPNTFNATRKVSKLFSLGRPITSPFGMTFLIMAMFYILMLALGVDWRLGIIGAAAFGLATNHVLSIEAGHSTKILALAYIPATLGGVLLAFRGKLLLGGALTAFFLSLAIHANHLQIPYYFFMILLIIGAFELFKAVKEQEIAQFAKAVGVIAIAGILSIAGSTERLWTTYEYADYTIRGKSEITKEGPYSQASNNKETGEGLSKNYAFSWSLLPFETFSVFIPNLYGGGSAQNLAYDPATQGLRTDTRSAAAVRSLPQGQINPALQKSGAYWGGKPFTSGPIYYGAIICFLFVLGMMLVKSNIRWWMLAGSILMMFIAMGKNFPIFSNFMFEYFPMYNKFRTPTMALGVGHILFITMAMLALKELAYNSTIDAKEKMRALYIAAGSTAGLAVLIYVIAPGFLSFTRENDFTGNFNLNEYPDYLSAIIADRKSMLRADSLRTILFIILSGGALWAYLKGFLKWNIVLPIVGVLILADFWLVDRRYVNANTFEEKTVEQQMVQPRQVDKDVMADQDPHFRVLDLSRGNPFSSAIPSFFHKSLGGYHAVKMGAFQDLCEYYLYNFNPTQTGHITGMLNVKYFILQNPQNGQPYVIQNQQVAGNAWLVDTVKYVANGDEEIAALANLDPRREAVVQNKFSDYLSGLANTKTPGDHVTLAEYKSPDHMVYNVRLGQERLAIFSEIYYPTERGWNIYINGEKQPAFIKANYALRAARLPAGEYTLEMKFEPKSYYLGSKISAGTSILVTLALLGGLYLLYRQSGTSEATTPSPLDFTAAKPQAKTRTSRKPSTSAKAKPTTKSRKPQPKKRKKK